MKRTHALLIVLAIAIAAVAGTFAALRTTQLRATAAPKVSAAQIAAQNRSLDKAQAALQAQLRQKPPALPPLPTAATSGAVAAAPSSLASAAAPKVVYVRPKPIVRVVHRTGGESGEHGESGETGSDRESSGQSSPIGSTFDD